MFRTSGAGVARDANCRGENCGEVVLEARSVQTAFCIQYMYKENSTPSQRGLFWCVVLSCLLLSVKGR